MGTTWVFLCLAMMQTEGRLNPDFVSVPDAMFNTFRVVSGQVREYRMMTHQGEVLLWLALFLLPLLFGWLTSDVAKDLLRSASVRLGRAIQRAQARDAYRGLIMFAKTPKRIIDWILRKQKGTKGPLIFLNWNERAEHMVNELRKDGKFADRRIIVVLPDASPLRSSAKIVGVDVVDGDPAARLTMERAGIVGAAAVTIVSSWSPADPHDRRRRLDPDAADTKTMLAILTIRSLCEEMHRTSVLQITAEIRLSRFEQEVKNAAHSEIMELTCLPV
jgi:hypothetical protein